MMNTFAHTHTTKKKRQQPFPEPKKKVRLVKKPILWEMRTPMRTWTYEEDHLLFYLIGKHGCKWTHLSSFFADRTPSMCRNRFYRVVVPHNPRSKSWKPSKNKCTMCGELKRGHSCAFVETVRPAMPCWESEPALAHPTIVEEDHVAFM